MSASPTKLPDPGEAERMALLAGVDPVSLKTIREKLDHANAVSWLVDHGLASEWPPPAPEDTEPVKIGYSPGLPTPDAVVRERKAEKARKRPRLVLTNMDDVEEEDVQWLWPGRFPRGALSTVMARMGTGKSTFRDWLTSTVSAGRAWPDCPDDNPARTVLILQAEEHKGRNIKGRLSGFDYGRGKVFTIDGTAYDGDDPDEPPGWFSIRNDIDILDRQCREMGDVGMVLIDPVGAYLKGIKGNNDIEVREVLQPLKDFAEARDIAVVLLAHPNKNSELPLLDQLSGSAAFAQIVRAIWWLSADPRDKSRRLLSLMKTNTKGTTKSAIALHFDEDRNAMTWFTDPLDLCAQDVANILDREARLAKMKPAKVGGRPSVPSKSAEDFLMKLLATGPASLSVCREKAMLLGISFSTLRRAINARVESKAVERYELDANGETRIWFRLPGSPADSGGENGQSEGASQ
jgi:hypothetical protein